MGKASVQCHRPQRFRVRLFEKFVYQHTAIRRNAGSFSEGCIGLYADADDNEFCIEQRAVIEFHPAISDPAKCVAEVKSHSVVLVNFANDVPESGPEYSCEWYRSCDNVDFDVSIAK